MFKVMFNLRFIAVFFFETSTGYLHFNAFGKFRYWESVAMGVECLFISGDSSMSTLRKAGRAGAGAIAQVMGIKN
jgi:hypothetical protein